MVDMPENQTLLNLIAWKLKITIQAIDSLIDHCIYLEYFFFYLPVDMA